MSLALILGQYVVVAASNHVLELSSFIPFTVFYFTGTLWYLSFSVGVATFCVLISSSFVQALLFLLKSSDFKMTPSKTAFFQVLVGDFTRHLKLPIAFVDSFKGTPPCNCVLRAPNGKSWNVELEEREDGLFFHTGWKQFVKKHFLERGDFLVFYYKGKKRFDVVMYDESVCEMDLEVFKRRNAASLGDRTTSDPVISRMSVIEETTFGTIIFKTNFSCFAKPAVTRDTRIWVTIPKRIVMAEGLTGEMTLKLLVANKRPSLVRTTLIQGWIRMGKGVLPFFRKNNISSRDTVVFEFIKPTVLQTHIFRDKEVLLVGPKIVNFRSKAS